MRRVIRADNVRRECGLHSGVYMNLFDLGRFKNIAIGLAAFMLLISMLLAFNVSMSNVFNNDLSGGKYVAQLQMKPGVIVANSHALDARLKIHEPISDAFTDL